MQEQIFHLQFAMDTFYFLVCGALVMWMAAGFAMLEAGLVRSKNTTEILTKNFQTPFTQPLALRSGELRYIRQVQ